MTDNDLYRMLGKLQASTETLSKSVNELLIPELKKLSDDLKNKELNDAEIKSRVSDLEVAVEEVLTPGVRDYYKSKLIIRTTLSLIAGAAATSSYFLSEIWSRTA